MAAAASDLLQLSFVGCNLTGADVDGVLAACVAGGLTGGTLLLSGNAVPSAAGLEDVTTLQARLWTVEVQS
jgi:hypothetical protein